MEKHGCFPYVTLIVEFYCRERFSNAEELSNDKLLNIVR